MVSFDVESSFVAEAVGMAVTSVILIVLSGLSIALEEDADTRQPPGPIADRPYLARLLPYYLRRAGLPACFVMLVLSLDPQGAFGIYPQAVSAGILPGLVTLYFLLVVLCLNSVSFVLTS